MRRIAKYLFNVCLWLICSLPVISFGAATVAMHFVNFKLVKDDSIDVRREFFKSFKQNFSQSIPLLIIYGAVGTLIGYCWIKQIANMEAANLFMVFLLIITSLVFLGFESTSSYLLAKFDNRTSKLIMLSIYSMLRHSDIVIKIAIMEAATIALPIFIIVINPVASFITAGIIVAFIMVIIHEITSARWITAIFDILIAAQNAAQASTEEEAICETTDKKQ